MGLISKRPLYIKALDGGCDLGEFSDVASDIEDDENCPEEVSVRAFNSCKKSFLEKLLDLDDRAKSGEVIDASEFESNAVIPNVVKQDGSTVTMRKVFELYYEQNKSNWRTDTCNAHKRYIKPMLNLFGDTLASIFTREHARLVRADLEKLTCSNKTKNNYIVFTKKIIQWGYEEGYLKEDCSAVIRLFKEDASESNSRDTFSKKEISIIYNDLLKAKEGTLKGFFPKPYHCWGAFLCLFVGMRPYEIAQLYKSDIYESIDTDTDEKMWIIAVTSENNNSNADNKIAIDKKEKGRGTRRYVPIPDKLIEIGFLDYVKSCLDNDRIFNDLTYTPSKETYGKAILDWFNGSFAPKIGVRVKGDNKTFYSLRHTVYTWITTMPHIDNTLRDEIIGHAKQGMAKYYFDGYSLSAKREAINSIVIVD